MGENPVHCPMPFFPIFFCPKLSSALPPLTCVFLPTALGGAPVTGSRNHRSRPPHPPTLPPGPAPDQQLVLRPPLPPLPPAGPPARVRRHVGGEPRPVWAGPPPRRVPPGGFACVGQGGPDGPRWQTTVCPTTAVLLMRRWMALLLGGVLETQLLTQLLIAKR